ncbi:MAG TPA: 2-phospho-L-lactate guanylyltransferase [Terriglobales bacterium]
MILVPVKNLSTAKQRLAALLDQPTRTALAKAMLQDVMEAIHAWRERPPVALVTSDEFAMSAAQKFGFEIIPDKENRSETDAIAMATEVCVQRRVESTLVIPADIPLVTPADLERITRSVPSDGSVLVASHDHRGSNAIWRKPADLFPLRFGSDSFQPHLAAARATRKPCVVLTLPGIGLDVDDPSDLRKLAAAAGDTHAQRFARQLDLSDLPRAASE